MYSMAEAAEAVGKSKSTILRAVKSGKLSATKNVHDQYEIVPAELHRVYPVASRDAGMHRSTIASRTTQKVAGEAAEMALKLAMAEKERDAAQSLADERSKTIDDLRDRLDKESEERRKMTAMLTDQRPRGFWERLRGK